MKRIGLSACPQAEKFQGSVPLTGFGLGTGRNIKAKRVICLFLFVCCLLWPCAQTVRAAETSIGEHFVGETLTYDVGFLWFDKAFSCVINLQRGEKPGEYVAILWGKSQGFVGWLTSYRERLFISYLEEVDGGRRFRTRHYEKRNLLGHKMSREVHDFDYRKRRWRIRFYDDGRLAENVEKELPVTPGFEDILSGLYNFRYGVYGPMVKGNRYMLPSFSREKDLLFYKVRLLTQREQDRHKLREKTDSSQGYLAHVKLDKEIFSTKEGILWVWLSPQFVARKGIVEDAIGFGDIYGYLKHHRVARENPTAFIPASMHFNTLFPQGLQ